MFADVAQMVEQRIRNAQVGGSSPPIGCAVLIFFLSFSFISSALKAETLNMSFGILDNFENTNSDGIISKGERAVILFSFEEISENPDSINYIRSPKYLIENLVIDLDRNRGNFTVIPPLELKPDTVFQIKFQIFSGQNIDTLLFEIPIAFTLDSVEHIISDSLVSFKVFHEPSLNIKYQRYLKITHFPSLEENIIELNFFDPTILTGDIRINRTGLFIAEPVYKMNDLEVKLKNLVHIFYLPSKEIYKYIVVADIDPTLLCRAQLMDISNLLRPDDIIIPFINFKNSEHTNTLNSIEYIILYLQHSCILDFNREFLDMIYDFSNQYKLILLSSSTLNCFTNCSKAEHLLNEKGLIFVRELNSVSGLFESKFQLSVRNLQVNNVIDFICEDTICRISSTGLVMRSSNITLISADLSSIAALGEEFTNNLINYLDNGHHNIENDTFIPPIEISRTFPNPVFQDGTTISLNLIKEGNLEISITDISGRDICPIYNGFETAGDHNYYWNGKDRNLNILPCGLYFITALYKSVSENYKTTHKILLVR